MLKKEPVWIFSLVFAAVAAGLAYLPSSVVAVIPPELIILLVAGIGGAMVRRFVTPAWKADDSVRLAEHAIAKRMGDRLAASERTANAERNRADENAKAVSEETIKVSNERRQKEQVQRHATALEKTLATERQRPQPDTAEPAATQPKRAPRRQRAQPIRK